MCLGQGDFASAHQMFTQLLVDWREALLETPESYLRIRYMLVGFQLVTENLFQRSREVWLEEGMLSSSIRKHLPQV